MNDIKTVELNIVSKRIDKNLLKYMTVNLFKQQVTR